MLIRRNLSWAIAFTLTALPCFAGDGAKGAVRESPDKRNAAKAYAACACEACELGRADVATLCAKLASGAAPAQFCEGTPAEHAAMVKKDPVPFYANALAQRPSDVPAALDDVAARFSAAGASAEERTRLLDFACSFPRQANERVAAAMWKASKASFATDHLVALAVPADAAPAELARELEQRASREFLAAAALALQGDARGKTLLERITTRRGGSPKSLEAQGLAALGLAALGDDAAVPAFKKAAHAAVLAALDAREIDRARRLAAELDLVSKLAQKGKYAQLGWFGERAAAHSAKLAARLDTSDAVFAFVEAIST